MISPEDLIGAVLGERYEILDFVARGGGGSIYRAKQRGLDRIVAVKTLYDDPDRDDLKTRFEREAALCAKLNDPNTVRVHDYGSAPEHEVLYIVMEFLDGQNLFDIIKEQAPFDPYRAIHITRQICGALGEAHDQGIVHRDMKPGNVLLVAKRDDPDFVKVVDFGLVKQLGSDVHLTTPGQVLGTPSYMAPEQIRGDPNIDLRADIYAIGSLMYMMLTRKRHLKGKDLGAMIRAHIHHEVAPFSEVAPHLDIPIEVEQIVMKCLQKDRKDRWMSCHALGQALQHLESDLLGTGDFRLPPPSLTGETALRPTPDFGDISPADTLMTSEVGRPGASPLMVASLLILLAILGVGVALLFGGGAVAFMTWSGGARPDENAMADALAANEAQAQKVAEFEAAADAAAKEKEEADAAAAAAAQAVADKEAARQAVAADPVEQGWKIVDTDPSAAAVKFKGVLDADPDNANARYAYGYALLKMNDLDAAAVHLCAARGSGNVEVEREIVGLIQKHELKCD